MNEGLVRGDIVVYKGSGGTIWEDSETGQTFKYDETQVWVVSRDVVRDGYEVWVWFKNAVTGEFQEDSCTGLKLARIGNVRELGVKL